jgi:hypothetical protein
MDNHARSMHERDTIRDSGCQRSALPAFGSRPGLTEPGDSNDVFPQCLPPVYPQDRLQQENGSRKKRFEVPQRHRLDFDSVVVGSGFGAAALV